MRELPYAIGAAPNQPLIPGRMACLPDYEQFYAEFRRKMGNALHRRPSHDMGMEGYTAFFRHLTCALKHTTEAPGWGSIFRFGLFDELRC